VIPYRPLSNQPSPPPHLPPPPSPHPLPPPIPAYNLPRPAQWWVFADTRMTGSKIHGTDEDAYDMSNTEVKGSIRVAADKPIKPVVADLKDICPCFLRHGGQVPRCQSRRGICNSTPSANEVCFESHKSVSLCSTSLLCIAAQLFQCKCWKVHLMTTCSVWHDGGKCDQKRCNHGHDVDWRSLRADKSCEHALHHDGR